MAALPSGEAPARQRRGGGARRPLAAVLAVLAAALGGLSVLAALPWLSPGGTPPPAAAVIGLAATGAGATWVLATLLSRHFGALERLRDDLVVAGGAGRPLPPRWSRPGADDAGAELRDIADAAARLQGRAAAGAADGRLAAVVAAASEGLLVVTGTGLVSLVNAAALQRLGAERVAVGTSVYAALDRAALAEAARRAAAAGRPERALLRTVTGDALEATVADLGHHGGLVVGLAADPAGPCPAPAVHLDLGLHDAAPEAGAAEDGVPLAQLSAVALDTETTGLDVETARVVSVGAVRLHGARVLPQAGLDLLARPDVPIPAAATAVHGIDDAMVAAAPPMAGVLPRIAAMIGEGAVVGHNIGFDLTVLEREAGRAGVAWRAPLSLDTGLLMAALDPSMTVLDLDALAARLGVAVEGRHTALGDALVTAEIYVRLLPLMEARGIRTLGAARALAASARRLRRRQEEAGWRH